MNRASTPVTMKRIAQATGLSRPTVSMALSNKGTLSAETRAKVLKVAEELGYRPNAGARALHQGQFGNIGLLLSTDQHRSNLPHAMLSGIEETLAAHDIHLTVASFTDSKLIDGETLPRMLREWMCEGLLINYTSGIPPMLGKLIAKHRIPAVWINTKLKSDCVYPDDEGAAYAATKHLLTRGHTRIAYLDSRYYAGWTINVRHFSSEARLAGYLAAMKRERLTPTTFFTREPQAGDHSDFKDNFDAYAVELRDRMVHAMKRPDRITAFVSYQENETVLWEAAALAGLSVPKDLSIITFGGDFVGRESRLLLPHRDLGVRAAKMMLDKLQHPRTVYDPVALPFEFRDVPTSIGQAV